MALLVLCLHHASATLIFADTPALAWTEDFATDPVAAGRFTISPAEFASRFTYDSNQALLTAHYDTALPTVWYMRPLDPAGGRTLGRYDDFEFSVTFRIQGAEFDPNGYGQIAWGLLNSQTTGEDRPGCLSPPESFAYDTLSLDYFPNSAYETLCPTIIHSDTGIGTYESMDFAAGAETWIQDTAGDEGLVPDTIYVARVAYDGLRQIATLTIRQGDRLLNINADGGQRPGGPDSDPTTIQNQVYVPSDFVLDSFALTAWEDTCAGGFFVAAGLDIFSIEFLAPAVQLGDMNHDGLVDGRDIDPFVKALLSADPTSGELARGDFDANGVLDLVDVGLLVTRLTQP